MPETFTTRQLAVIAATNKIVTWLFRVTDNLGTEYHWSTGTVAAGTGSITIGAQESPSIWTHGEWDTAHTFKIVNFNGITLRRSKSEYGINAPNDVSFSIVNGSNTLTASNFKGGIVRIALVVDDGSGKEVVGSWRFVIKSASPYNQQIDVTCEDFLQQYLRGTYPNTRLISEIFPANTDNTIIKDNVCVPEVYGTAYIPLRSVYAGSARYYLLGPATDKTYTISEVRNPRATGAKITWASPAFAMTQSTQSTWRVFQPIISASTGGGAVDSPGLWENGDTFWDIPTKFSEVGTVSVTSPADVIRRVLLNMGVMDYDLNGASFDTARTTFTSWGLEWNFAFYYKEDRAKVLSKLLAMCHCCLVVGEQISLQVLSAASVKTLTAVEVTKPDETGPSSFRYTDSLAEKVSDSGYVAWQQTGESQDLFLKAKVPAKSATDYPDSETIELPGVQDSQKIQKLGTLYYQRKLLKSADISANLKGTCLIVRPDDVVTVNYADFGGTYNVLTDEVTIKPDASMDIRAIKFSEVLDDWADLAPAAITVATDSTTNTYSPVYAGPDSPGSTNLPNALPGRLRIGQTTNYILLDPNSPLRISLYSSDVERMRFGNLNGFLDYVTNLYGQAIGDATNYLKYDPTNGLRISGALSAGTIDIGGADASSFHVDANGNMWLGASTFDIATNPFAVSNAGVLRAVSGTIGGWTLAATTLTGTGITLSSTGDAYLAIGTTPPTAPTTGTGIFANKTGMFGLDANNQRFKLGTDGSGFLGASDIISWTTAGVVSIAGFGATNSAFSVAAGGNTTTISATGTNAFIAGTTGAPTVSISHAGVLTATGASISGTLTATTGTIGGFTLSATALYAGTIATRIQLDTTSGIHLGATAFADAPFKVSLAGALTATSATISGAVTATSGSVGSFTIGTYLYTGSKTAYNDANAGVHLGSDGIGIGNNVFTVSAAGALVATSATITGAITATSGTFTGTINATAGKFGTATNYWSVGATGLTAVSASTDVFINYGKTDFTNTDTGFILGYDFSASKAKFYVGDSTSYLNWDGAALTYTKGTLVETIIQMYTSVASLKTSATAGDGSVNSAGMVLTYEGLFGCGASQTATVAAANANVRILATGAAYFKGVITADTGYIGGTSGWVISANYIKDVAGVVGLSSVVTAGDDIRFWAGHATPASAPFYVTEAGALVATSATITGAITISSGSGYANISDKPTSLSNINGTEGTKLSGIEAGADVTSSHTAANITGQGALATVNSADFATQVSGAEKPANNATVGATWGTNLNSIPTTLTAPSGDGLYLSSTYMGFYASAAWKTYMDNAGNLLCGDIAGGNAGLSWSQAGATLTVRGAIYATSGSFSGAVSAATIDIGGDDATSFHVDIDGGIWSGASIANKATAPFRVSNAGALVATSATITGAITASSGSVGSFTIGTYLYTGSKTAYNDTNAGVHIGSDGIGIGNNVFTVSAAGALVATSATITGTVVDAITLGHSSNILLAQGGSIKFTSVSSPTACTASLVTTGTGNVTDGSHEYGITFVTATGETSLGTISNSVTVDASHKQVNLTNIPLSSSPAVTARKIYRNLAGGAIHFYLATISDNTTTIYTDNIADGSLGTYSWDSRQNDTFGKIINDSIEILSVGSTNTLVGYNTARSVNLGKNITFIGADAGYTNTTGGASVAVGTNALYLNSSGAYNTCVGFSSLYKTTAGGNVGVGAYAGWAITTGTNNVFLGYGAGQNSQLATATNSIAIGYNTQTTASNQIVLGNTSITKTLLQGNILVGITAVGTSAAKVLGIGNGTAPTTAPANVGQLWCEDINGAAGYAGLHMMVETNAVKLVVPGVYIKGTTGQIANPFEGLLEINTFDNTVKMYADAGWRTLASGW